MSTATPVAAIPLPIGVMDLDREANRLTMEHGQGLTLRQHGQHLIVYTPGEPFDYCRRCQAAESQLIEDLIGGPHWMTGQMMILCPTCGNKRCPHATDHLNACTGSNDPGQPGSVYA